MTQLTSTLPTETPWARVLDHAPISQHFSFLYPSYSSCVRAVGGVRTGTPSARGLDFHARRFGLGLHSGQEVFTLTIRSATQCWG